MNGKETKGLRAAASKTDKAKDRKSTAAWGEASEKRTHKAEVPQGRRRSAQLDLDGGGADPTLLKLQRLGLISEVLGEVKSGKEATVYLARGPQGLTALKLYRDLQARSFKNDAIYRAGRFIGDARTEKAITQRSSKGMRVQQALWTAAEYAVMWRLHRAGVPVPEPLVGPDPSDYLQTSPAVLMRYIGDEDAPAARLSEATLTPEQAQSAWAQALSGMAALLRLGLVHGDYSTYNLLWWEERVIIIDFPQVSDRTNPNFQMLLERDAATLALSFGRLGVRESAEATLRAVQRLAREPGAEETETPVLSLP